MKRQAKNDKRETAGVGRRWHLPFLVFRLSLFVLLPGLCGCRVLGVVAYKVAGPPDVPALYVLPKEPTLVLVENYQHQSSAAASTDLLAQYVAQDLETRKLVPIVPLEKLQELRDSRPAEYGKMSITAIGKQVGASQIVYVQLHNSDATPVVGGEGFTGQATASIKVVSAASGETLWPTDLADGHMVAAKSHGTKRQASSPTDVRRELNAKLTEEISKCFRKWKPDDLSPEFAS